MDTIQTKNLSFKYSGEEKFALTDVSFSLEQSQILLLCGESGSGKTTLLRQLKPELTPKGEKTGNILYYGTDISELDNQKSFSKIGYLFQNPEEQLICDVVWRELAFGSENLGLPENEIELRIAETASFFGIERWMDMPVCKLSGGQKQILNLASIMILRPSLLLLDEPTSQLDPIAASRFYDILFRLHREIGTAMIISEHQTEELFSCADKVAVLEKGKLLFCGTPSQTAAEIISKRKDLSYFLPTAAIIAGRLGEKAKLPLTVAEGRRFLQKSFISKGDIETKFEEEYPLKEEKAIEVKRVSFRYNREGSDVLRNCSFSVPKGCVFGIVGSNGSGKSTLLRMITGELIPYAGKILLFGKKVNNKKNKICPELVAALPQNPQLLFSKSTVWEELCENYLETDAKEILEKSRFLERKYAHPYDLSGGESQKLAFYKVIAKHPKILLLDEPTKGLDGKSKKELNSLIKEYKSNGNTVLIVSHDLDFCAETADFCGMMFDGSVGSVDKTKNFFECTYFYTTTPSRIAKCFLKTAVTIDDVCLKCKKTNIDK